MREVRMMIEDYELMIHGRRAFLDRAKGTELAGGELSAAERRAVAALEKDSRLEGAVLMTWESTPEGDMGWVSALKSLLEHVEEDLKGADLPSRERDAYLQQRREAIERTLGKLDGSLVPP